MEQTLSSAWSIELASDDPTARLAAAELQATLVRLGAPRLPIVAGVNGLRIVLHHGLEGDGFVRAPDAAGFHLRGEGPRGLLYAVYDLLEALGCRWPAPGPAGERVPMLEQVTLPKQAVADRPALARRGLIIGHDHFLSEGEAWIIWAARRRLNTLFIHTTIQRLALGACRLSSWRARRAQLLPLIRARGMRLELGGHHLRDLLPRRLFRRAPELFRHNGLRRTPDHNLCPSSPQALELLRRNAGAFFRAYPEAELYHLWPDDLRAGGWCCCAECAALTPADQALIVANALAAALAAVRPAAQLSYLAYHDTEAPPAVVAPAPNLCLLFAPRLRSYAVGVGAPPNALVAERLRRGLRGFRQPKGAPVEAAVFEYYLDGILFKSAPPPLPNVLAADLRYYCDVGVAGVHALLTGERPFRWVPVNAHLFAQLAWNPDADPVAALADYAAARAPGSAAALAEAYSALETAWQPALARDPGAPEAEETPRQYDLVAVPPADVLDLIVSGPPANERRLEAMLAVEAGLSHGERAWRSVLADPAGGAQLAEEYAEWQLGAALLRFLRLRQELYVLAERRAASSVLRAQLDKAQSALDVLMTWSEQHLPPRARPEHRLLRVALQLQLDHIADRHLLAPWHRLSLRVRRAAALARHALGLDWR